MEFKLPGFKNKKDVTDSSVSFEEKKHCTTGENESYL